MTCENLLTRIGYECREVAGRSIAVTTPFSFPDGETIGFYIRDERDDRVILHDNADTIAHLISMGLEFPHRMGDWRTIKNIVEAWGLELQENGTITVHGPRDRQAQLVTNYISAMLAVSDFQREHFGFTEEQADYIAQVELHLRAWKPNAPFEKSPMIKGHSGKEYRFHFQLGDQLVEAARPHGRSTGAVLRKSIDVKNAGDRSILVIMDDREETDGVRQEIDILSAVVSVMPFTTLVRNAEGGMRQ
jgi:hypothetical protein